MKLRSVFPQLYIEHSTSKFTLLNIPLQRLRQYAKPPVPCFCHSFWFLGLTSQMKATSSVV